MENQVTTIKQGWDKSPEGLPQKISVEEAEARIKKIVRWAGYIAQDLHSDHIVQQLALESLNMIVGPGALHNLAELKSKEKLHWAEDLLVEALRNAKNN